MKDLQETRERFHSESRRCSGRVLFCFISRDLNYSQNCTPAGNVPLQGGWG